MGNCHCMLIDESNSTNCDICNTILACKYYFCDYCNSRYHSKCLHMHYSSNNTCSYCKKQLRLIDLTRASCSEDFSTIHVVAKDTHLVSSSYKHDGNSNSRKYHEKIY